MPFCDQEKNIPWHFVILNNEHQVQHKLPLLPFSVAVSEGRDARAPCQLFASCSGRLARFKLLLACWSKCPKLSRSQCHGDTLGYNFYGCLGKRCREDFKSQLYIWISHLFGFLKYLLFILKRTRFLLGVITCLAFAVWLLWILIFHSVPACSFLRLITHMIASLHAAEWASQMPRRDH